jgi:CRISPR/Cas system endoribonuclease Cas6 (RAMP superfamily)
MKFKITLQCADTKRFSPIDYQYFVSAWVYNVLSGAEMNLKTYFNYNATL